MKRFHLYFLLFFSTMWSMNVMAFEVDGINYRAQGQALLRPTFFLIIFGES